MSEEQKQLLTKKEKVRFYPAKEDKKEAILLKGLEFSLWLNKVLTRKDQKTMFPLKVTHVVYKDDGSGDFEYKPLKESPIWLTPGDLRKLHDYIGELLMGEIFE